MVKRVGGFRRKTRHKLSKNIREKGKISLNRYFQSFQDGERVYLAAEPSYQRGMYFPRFHGMAAVVAGKQGSNYYVEISDGGKKKQLLVHPIHLKKCQK